MAIQVLPQALPHHRDRHLGEDELRAATFIGSGAGRSPPRITLADQHESGDRYVALGGQATLIEDRTEIRALWGGTVSAHFPEGDADANMIEVRVDVDRIEVHARGITREPSGHGRT